MTVPNEDQRNDYVGSGITGPYTFDFRIFSEDQLHVFKTLISTGISSDLALTTDYTVDGVGEEAGSITLVSTLSSLYTLHIVRDVDCTQNSVFANQRQQDASTWEDTFDYCRMVDLKLKGQIDASIKLPESDDPADFDNMELPGVAQRAGKILAFDDDGAMDLMDSDTLDTFFASQSHYVANPFDFDATGDGVTDDSAAMQAALDTGRSVFIPNATFYMGTTKLTMNQSNQSVFGVGPQSTLLWSDSHVDKGIEINESNVELRDFYISKPLRSSAPSVNAVGVYQNSHDGKFINLKISSEGAGAHAGWSQALRATLYIQHFKHCIFTGELYGINSPTNANFLSVLGGTFSAYSTAGINLVGGSGNSIIGADIEGPSTYGIRIEDGGDASSGHGTASIEGCYLEGQGTGISLVGSSGPGKNVRGVAIGGCFFGTGTTNGIALTRVDGVSVKGCNFVGCSTTGITAATAALNLDINANYMPASGGGFTDFTLVSGWTGRCQTRGYRAMARISGNQSINSASSTRLDLGATVYDPESMVSLVNNVITIAVTGKYRVTSQVLWAANATGERRILLTKNSSSYYLGEVGAAAMPTSDHGQNITATASLTAADTIDLFVVQTSGAPLNLLDSADRGCWISIEKIDD